MTPIETIRELVGLITVGLMGFIPGILIGATLHRYILEDDED